MSAGSWPQIKFARTRLTALLVLFLLESTWRWADGAVEGWTVEPHSSSPLFRHSILPARQQRLERALLAERLARAAEAFSDHHQLSVVILPIVEAFGGWLFVQRLLAKRL